MMTSSTSPGATLARLNASRIAIAPSSGAESDESPPRNLPIGVRAAPTMTGILDLSVISVDGLLRQKANRVGQGSPRGPDAPRSRRQHASWKSRSDLQEAVMPVLPEINAYPSALRDTNRIDPGVAVALDPEGDRRHDHCRNEKGPPEGVRRPGRFRIE